MAGVKPAGPPPSVQVGHVRYKVVVDELAILKAGLAEGGDLDGSCDERSQRIVLNPSLGPDVLAESFTHELLHAVFFVGSVEQMIGTDKTETVIRAISPTLLETLRRNPDVVAYLTAER